MRNDYWINIIEGNFVGNYVESLNGVGYDYEDEEENYEEDRKLFGNLGRKNKVVAMPQQQIKMKIAKPTNFDQVDEIIIELKQKNAVVINLEYVSKDVARRIVDVVSGATKAIDGHMEKVSNSIFVVAPFNYDIVNEITKEKTIIVDPVKAPLVKKVFEEFAAGKHTLKSICEYANKLGLKSVYNNVITPGCMSSLLHNKFYCGFFSDKHKTKTFTHDYPKLISMDTFIKIQAILEKKNKKLPKPNPYNSHVFILSNLITCKCGCQMTCYEKRKPNGKTYRYIKCSHVINS